MEGEENEERKEAGVKKLKKFTEYESYGSGEKVGIVIGAMARIEQNCTDNEGRVKGVIGVVSDLHAAGYPNRVIKKGIERMGKKVGGAWKEMKKLVKSL